MLGRLVKLAEVNGWERPVLEDGLYKTGIKGRGIVYAQITTEFTRLMVFVNLDANAVSGLYPEIWGELGKNCGIEVYRTSPKFEKGGISLISLPIEEMSDERVVASVEKMFELESRLRQAFVTAQQIFRLELYGK